MAGLIVTIIILIPVYIILIWSYVEPEESMLFGERWMYQEDPEFSTRSIQFRKFTSLMLMIGIPLFIIGILIEKMIYWLVPAIFIVVFVIGVLKILAEDD
ncbi:hypothetical protein [Ornithinibacillus halotolerans]|uniref:DUF3784 domain-containing protein n=1 Tax=Ornithinibacillus halotolerans TaxID=1274357 RepID=A0A916RWH0_9BACI|nr:hypothetical protein [Ornithinibacillus halotolerans]GGA72561.1 hypothetical protein GCM10008025_15440 [Ornithinibacillus halotolerans]